MVPFSILLMIAELVTVGSAAAVGVTVGATETLTVALGAVVTVSVGAVVTVSVGAKVGVVVGSCVDGILLASGEKVGVDGVFVFSGFSLPVGVVVASTWVGSKEEAGVALIVGVLVATSLVGNTLSVVEGIAVLTAVFVGAGVLLFATIQRIVAVFPLNVFAVIVVSPAFFAVTEPLAETLATVVFSDL